MPQANSQQQGYVLNHWLGFCSKQMLLDGRPIQNNQWSSHIYGSIPDKNVDQVLASDTENNNAHRRLLFNMAKVSPFLHSPNVFWNEKVNGNFQKWIELFCLAFPSLYYYSI
jgi:hypothetical protein